MQATKSHFRQLRNWLIEAEGVATSLVEATATIAVGAVLASVAITGGIDAINDSKIQAAISDVRTIGQGVTSFYKDNAFFPLFPYIYTSRRCRKRTLGETGGDDIALRLK